MPKLPKKWRKADDADESLNHFRWTFFLSCLESRVFLLNLHLVMSYSHCHKYCHLNCDINWCCFEIFIVHAIVLSIGPSKLSQKNNYYVSYISFAATIFKSISFYIVQVHFNTIKIPFLVLLFDSLEPAIHQKFFWNTKDTQDFVCFLGGKYHCSVMHYGSS